MNTRASFLIRVGLATALWALAIVAGAARAASAAEPKVAAAACDLTSPTLARLGFAALPHPLAQEYRLKLKASDSALRRAKFADAVAMLDELAAKNPDDGELRFRLAAAHAASGDLHAACGEIARLLELDFVGFVKRYETDPAFSSLRSSEAGNELREHLRAVEALWQQSIPVGLPAMLSAGTRGQMTIWRPSRLRGGVYVHETKRFLPMEPGVDGASAALVNPEAKIVGVVKLAVSACQSDFCPRISSAQIMTYSLDDFRRPPVRWSSEEKGSTMTMLDLRSGSRGAAVRLHDCCCWKGCMSPWTSIGPKPGAADAAHEQGTLEMSIDFRGSLLEIVPPAVRIAKGRLTMEGSAETPLGPEHETAAVHDVLVDQQAGALLVFSAIDRCECSAKKEGPVFRYAISTVDAKSGKATAIEHGEGTGAALLDGKRAVYVQTGNSVRRWPSISSVGREPGEPIMPGVVLVVPRSPSGNCCGL